MARLIPSTLWHVLAAAAALSANVHVAAAAASSGGYPSYEQMLYARASVGTAQGQVQMLLGRIYEGGARPQPEWPRRGSGELGWADNGEELENDQLAGFALQGLGASLNRLGQEIDAATANYGQPQFPFFLAQACTTARRLVPQAQAGRVSASIPNEVLVHGYDFDPIIQEAFAVKSQLGCF